MRTHDGQGYPHRFKVLLEWDRDERVWVTYVPSLDHLSTYGETREEALQNTQEAILGYLETAEREGISVPDADTAELVEVEIP
ncbi:MAG: type II toxin-antitoxin system HicB family antitoxin [Bacilli bacterium]